MLPAVWAMRITVFFAISAAVAVFSGCRFPLSYGKGPVPIEFRSSILSLSWDAENTGIEGVSSATSRFDLFYRELGSTGWIFLKSTPGSQSSVSVMHRELGDGDFEFAVQAVYKNEKKSDLHGSTDFSAWPSGGWYVRWRMP